MSLSKKFEKHIGIITFLLNKKNTKREDIQKLIYLIERNENDLNLKFGISYYGVYSKKLDDILNYMILKKIIKVNNLNLILIDNTLNFKNKLTHKEIQKILFILNNFKNKNFIELEGITTVDFFMQKDLLTSDIKIIEDIKRSTGTKFENIKLEDYFETLRVHGYIN